MRALLLVPVALCVACGARTGLEVPEERPRRDAAVPDARPPDSGPTDACVRTRELCDGVDQDCDGAIDDGITCYTLDREPIDAITTSLCGIDWYAYDSPDTASANPVPDVRVSGRVTVAIVESPAPCGGASIALIADLPNDGSGGSLMGWFASAPAPRGRLLVGDEPGECVDDGSGLVACNWTWQPCCTDGAMVGPFDGDFCVQLTLENAVGVTSLAVIDGGDAIERPLDVPITLCGETRPEVP